MSKRARKRRARVRGSQPAGTRPAATVAAPTPAASVPTTPSEGPSRAVALTSSDGLPVPAVDGASVAAPAGRPGGAAPLPMPSGLAERAVAAVVALPGWTRDLAALGCLALAAAALLAETLLWGYVHAERDTYLFYYPVYQWFAAHLKAGHLPLWIPHMFSGYPLLADGETGMYYPLHWLFFGLLPTPVAFIALRYLHFVLAGAFMYAWLRVLTLRRLAALLGAVTFAYGSFLVGQMHHENLVRTAVWLPLVLCWAELTFRHTGRTRWRCLLAGGATLGVQLTALHVQPALMTMMALALYVAFRTFWPPTPCAPVPPLGTALARWLAGRLALGAAVLGGILALGGGLAFAQLLPLYELGMQTFRGERVPFAFATSYSLHPSQLATLLFPYFFRNDQTGSWPLWVGWETVLYVGVAPLVLAGVGLVVVRRREVGFFAALGLFGALLAFGDYSPVPLLELLWPLPGFSALRVPGRYSFLLVVALAALAAYGLDWLQRAGAAPGRRWSLLGVVVGVNASVVALLLGFIGARQLLLAAPDEAKAVIRGTYLAVRRMLPELSADQVYAGLLYSLDLGNRRTELAFGLLLVVGVLLALCYLWRRPTPLWHSGLVLLAAADLVLWGRSFHARLPLADLLRPPPVVQSLLDQGAAWWHGPGQPPDRLWVASDTLREVEVNRPVLWGIAQAGGYSSLEPQREAEWAAVVANTPGLLLDLWSARWVAAPTRGPSLPVYKSVGFYPGRALFDGGARNPAGDERFVIPDRPATEVRLIAALSYADDIIDGATVAELVVTSADGRTRTLPIVAGQHVSEWAHERGDVRPRVRHRLAEVAYLNTDYDINGQAYHFYYFFSQHPLPERWTVRHVRLRYVEPKGVLRVFGMALYDGATGDAYQVSPFDRAKLRRVYADQTVTLYENTAAFPRAWVVSGAVLPRPEQQGLYSMYLEPFDPTTEVLLDEPPPINGVPVLRMGQGAPPEVPQPGGLPDRGVVGSVRAATVESYAEERVVVRATAERPGFLVLAELYHPGWRAWVDGVETEVLRGNHFFRAVPLGPGTHEVEFVFDPASVRVGQLVSLSALVVLFGAVLALWRWPRRAG